MQGSSCKVIELCLRAYPEFKGEDYVLDSVNEYQALMVWNNSGWRQGVFSVEVELDVNTVGPGPVNQDEDEEITIIVDVSLFRAKATMIE